jgi:enoyl-CoA hydratase
MSQTFGPWTLEDDGPLAVLTVAKPPLNLFDKEVDEGLHAAVDHLVASPPRALLLRAEGKVWTAGVDVNLFAGLVGNPEGGAELWERGFELVHKLEDLPCPVVFAAHALCLTWGLEIALACDLLLAAESAQFGLVETRVGLTPSMGGPQRMAERAGAARAKQFVMTGALYDAATMESWGVVTRVYPDAEFEEKSRALARRLAAGPTKAHAATKAIIRAQKEDGARAADAIVPAEAGALFATEDLKNAVHSFLTDGPGKFEGYEGR